MNGIDQPPCPAPNPRIRVSGDMTVGELEQIADAIRDLASAVRGLPGWTEPAR
jgi:hypothetical protein